MSFDFDKTEKDGLSWPSWVVENDEIPNVELRVPSSENDCENDTIGKNGLSLPSWGNKGMINIVGNENKNINENLKAQLPTSAIEDLEAQKPMAWQEYCDWMGCEDCIEHAMYVMKNDCDECGQGVDEDELGCAS